MTAKMLKENNLNQNVISRLTGNPVENKALLPLDSRVKPENDKEKAGRSTHHLSSSDLIGGSTGRDFNAARYTQYAQCGRSTHHLSSSDLIRGSTGRDFNAARYTQYAQCGRSMVEMLGVLAVMGVLSVGGVAMYTSAMNKHRANELLNEASKRAVMVAGQLLTNPSATTMSLAQFGSNAVAGGTFGENAAIANGKITLTVSGVETAVCNQMKAATGDNAAMVVDDNCTKITFNTDMSKGSASTGGATCTETPTGCQACVGGELVDDDAKCDTGKVCVDGTCSSDALTGSGCAKNSDCETVAACTGGKCFCNFGGDVNDCTGPTGKNGTCTSVESFTESTDLAGFVRGKSTDWFSAKNFCAALPGNKRIAALSDFNCPYTLAQYKATGWGYCCAEEGSSIQSECPSDGWNTKLAAIKEDTGGTGFWIKDLTNNSCKAFAVDTGVSYVSYSDRSNPNSALCK